MTEITYLTIDEITDINKEVGSNGSFINRGNLEFTLDKTKNAKNLIKKATVLLFGIITGHPFADGNKRTAFVSMELFLKVNGKELNHGKADEYLMERILYDVAEKRITEESIEKIISDVIK